MSDDDLQRSLGRVEGKLDMVIEGQETANETMASLDERLRKVETKAAINGAVAGGLISIGLTLATEKLKATFGIGG